MRTFTKNPVTQWSKIKWICCFQPFSAIEFNLTFTFYTPTFLFSFKYCTTTSWDLMKFHCMVLFVCTQISKWKSAINVFLTPSRPQREPHPSSFTPVFSGRWDKEPSDCSSRLHARYTDPSTIKSPSYMCHCTHAWSFTEMHNTYTHFPLPSGGG